MKRTRNIILWLITALFLAGALFFIAVMRMGLMIGIAAVVIPTLVLLMIFKPEKMGLAKPMSTDAKSVSKVVLPAVFQVELCLESINLPKVIRIPIEKPKFTIGRNSNCDFSMQGNKRLSGKHVTIQFNQEDHSYSVIDHNTTNGTLLNRERIAPDRAVYIQKNDILELPGIIFKVRSAYS